jgi:hypothetical protein
MRGRAKIGDVWTWVGLDADTKLAIAWAVGDRGPRTAYGFMKDLACRLANRVQLTADGHKVYLTAVERAFGWDGVDYAMLVTLYAGGAGISGYSPPDRCVGTEKSWIMGQPVEADVLRHSWSGRT